MKELVQVNLTLKSVKYFSNGVPIINDIKFDTWDVVEKYEIGINISKNQDVAVDQVSLYNNRNGKVKSVFVEYF
jgi:hypothetical protein